MTGNHISKKNCCGCTLCSTICPKKCIKMEQNFQGFYEPIINEKECIQCGKCLRLCPTNNSKSLIKDASVNIKQIAYAGITNNKLTWKKSSSGGAFTEICNAFFEYNGSKNCVFFGATMDNLKVVHKCTTDIKKINMFSKSKYVQSDVRNIFESVESFLNKHYKVLFSGTPCEISALKRFLGDRQSLVFYVDFICHGVGSPKVFERFINEEEKKEGKEIVDYSFREKNNSGDCYLSKITYVNGKTKTYELDSYNRLFLNQMCINKNCSNCEWKNDKRVGDITIADFKGLLKCLPSIKDWRAHSAIIINSEKGKRLLKYLDQKMKLVECYIEIIKKNNPFFYRNKYRFNNDSFFNYYCNSSLSIDELAKKYTDIKKRNIIKRIIHRIPMKIRYPLIRIIEKEKI